LNIRTRQLINAPLIALARKNTVLLNFARADVVDSQAVLSALEEGRLQAYVSDFPIKALKNHPKAITLPHLGASTAEAEENCAIMAADTLREFLENGTVRHSVNYPDAALSRKAHTTRIAIAHRNARSLLEEISTCLVSSGLRIVDLSNGARDDCGYTLIDTDAPARQLMLTRIRYIEGVLSVRVC
jgi:D-3-phosphoglycerate dehydrogenase